MTSAVKNPVRNGKVAAAIREGLKAKGLTPAEFNEAMDYGRSHSAIYMWRAAKAAPGPEQREKVAKVLGLTVADLTPNEGAVVVTARKPVARAPVIYDARPVEERLAFTVGAHGSAKITLNVELPLARAMVLFPMLMEALKAEEVPDGHREG